MCLSSEEGSTKSGLGYFNFKLVKIKKKGYQIPHMGFNKGINYNDFTLTKNLKHNYFILHTVILLKVKKFQKIINT